MPTGYHHRTRLEAWARKTLNERKGVLEDVRLRMQGDSKTLYEERESDWEDRAANVSAATSLERIGEAERAELLRVDAAIARLDAGTWGRCTRCSKVIDDGRLRALPTATQCVACAELAGEKAETQL